MADPSRSTSPPRAARRWFWLTAGLLVWIGAQSGVLGQPPAAFRSQPNRGGNPVETSSAANGSGAPLGSDRAEPQAVPLRPAPPAAVPGAAADGAAPGAPQAADGGTGLPGGMDVDRMLAPGGMTGTLKVMLLLTVLSLAPSILIMTTCFVRFVVVIGLLRQALGLQQSPPGQVVTSLCLFLTFLVMAPVWQRAYDEGIRPYSDPRPGEAALDLTTALERTGAPLRRFMGEQIEATGNSDAVWMFLDHVRPSGSQEEPAAVPESYDEVPWSVLLPAFLLSELKTAFVIGFQLYLPFLIIDMVVSSVLVGMGMMMLPPTNVALPFKLLLFVLIDGWDLVVGMMLESVKAST